MAETKPPRKKRVEINFEELEKLMRWKPTLADTAAWFKVSEDTIERLIKATDGLRFAEFRRKNMVHVRIGLVQKAISMAMKGDKTMLIFSLKNMCGWGDVPDKFGEEEIEGLDFGSDGN